MIRRAAGRAAVAILKGISRLPIPLVHAAALPFIPFYLALRPRVAARLWSAAPHAFTAPAFPFAYYSMRVRLALLSLRHLLRRADGCTYVVENEDLYHAALRSGSPVVLLGWHQGPVEQLHRIPHAAPAAAGRTKVLMTAGAFAPALADFMHAGRALDGKEIARPGDVKALRRWEREKGILAVMIDQAPGRPREWLPVGSSGLRAPYPARLMEWIEARAAERLFVTVRWEPGNVVRFRYLPVAGPLKSSAFACMTMTETFGSSRLQYNWSYPKISAIRSRLLGIVVEGQAFTIEGIDVWEHPWRLEESAFVKHPDERRVIAAARYVLDAGHRSVEFVATELSNGVWGFFRPERDAT